jgi:hypothetical protein
MLASSKNQLDIQGKRKNVEKGRIRTDMPRIKWCCREAESAAGHFLKRMEL